MVQNRLTRSLGDPHLLRCARRRHLGAAHKNRVIAIRRCIDLDFPNRRGQCFQLLGQALNDALDHGRAARQNDVGVQILADVNITFHNCLEGGIMDATRFLADEVGLEQHLGAAEALAANGDDVPVRKLIRLLRGVALGHSLIGF